MLIIFFCNFQIMDSEEKDGKFRGIEEFEPRAEPRATRRK